MKKITSIILVFLFVTDAIADDKNSFVKVLIRSECKEMFYGPEFLGRQPEKMPSQVLWDSSRAKPFAFNDGRTQITFYVESDGRHLAAMNAQGKLLWVRNPFEESKGQCEYSTPRPVIVSIEIFERPESLKFDEGGPVLNINHKFIMIRFDSSQFGIVDEETGNYIWLGQN